MSESSDAAGVPYKIGSDERTCSVEVKNVSNDYFLLQIGYRYTSEPHRFTDWLMLGPNQKTTAFDKVSYWTGWTTSGQVQWKIQGIKMEQAHSSNGMTLNYDGKYYVMKDLHLAEGGIWNKHELRVADEGKTVMVEVGTPESRVVSIGDGVRTLNFAPNDS